MVLFLEIDHATFYTLMESWKIARTVGALFFEVEVDETRDYCGGSGKVVCRKFIKF